ncbi:disease resistance protein At4g27190-like [Olea europaea var. sylvestris]|uniref:disease resistance protein At4g27190-like n=1 Tax=Olea europaea var. sylvestris TaxID=158386 RepID=UPI000C1CFC25|nr:disease resistance protein At4g27190-like [Olea europaea var. sylvestris]
MPNPFQSQSPFLRSFSRIINFLKLLAMEVVAAALNSLLAEPCRLLVRSIYSRICNFLRSRKNFIDLQKNIKALVCLRDDLRRELDENERHENLPRTQVEEWLRMADELEVKVNALPSGDGCRLRYKLSRKLVKLLMEVKQLMEAGNFFENMLVVIEKPKTGEHIPSPSIMGQKTASQNLSKIMELLINDKVKRIGICGMGGVGKSTLVKNLNNEINKMPSAQPFSVIIWATSSRETNLRRIQIQIAERLNLQVKMEESEERIAIRLHKRLGKERRFLLLLDDVWDAVDLDLLGVPRPEDHVGSKIILTSRSFDVCRMMLTDTNIEVNALNGEEAWELFCQHAGQIVEAENIRPLAEAVAKECGGLPLAIIVVGASMRGKSMIALWKDALRALQRSVPLIKGIEDKVFNTLKWSYDSLQDEHIKSCFLFCCLYPEDWAIDVHELIRHWFSEGLLDECLNYEELENRGMAIVQSLSDSCLLEQSMFPNTVKMHDVVRDVCIWKACSSQSRYRSLVRSGIDLTWISEQEFLCSLKRVSLMNNEIESLPDCTVKCAEASTLLLTGNHNLKIVPGSFLQGFQSLRILNLSGSKVQSLPSTLVQLGELRALLLCHCFCLTELPSLEGLSKLQVLDCSGTCITQLPLGLEKLTDLRQLDISETTCLRTIPSRTISRLCNLEFLNLVNTAYEWGAKGESVEGQTPFEEVLCLKKLVALYVHLDSIPRLTSNNINWSRRIKRFKLFIGEGARMLYRRVADYHDNCVIINGLSFSQEWIGGLLCNAVSLRIHFCEGLNQMLERLVIDSTKVGCFAGLRSLKISFSHSTLKPTPGGCVASLDLLPNLEEIYLHSLSKLESFSDFGYFLGLRLSRLRIIDVFSCPQLKLLFSVADTGRALVKLEEIRIESCEMLKELFEYPNSGQRLETDCVAPNLRVLKSKNLPNLETVCRHNESWQHLQELEFLNCNKIRKLPITTQNEHSITKVSGELEWWNRLEWDNEDMKQLVKNHFVAVDRFGRVIDNADSII